MRPGGVTSARRSLPIGPEADPLALQSPATAAAATSDGTIEQANLDSTGVTTIVTGQNDPYGVAEGTSHIAWSDDRGPRNGTAGRRGDAWPSIRRLRAGRSSSRAARTAPARRR